MPKSKKTMQKDIETFDILIGTTSLLSYNLYRKSELVIFLNIDTDLMVSSAKAYERVIQNIKDFSLLLGDEGVLLIQTYSANNPIINFLKNCDFAKYYKEALIQREKISFPPFSQFIKLTYKHNDSKIVEFESEKLLDILLKQFASDKRVSILGPVALPQRFKKFAQEIVIKNCGNHEDMQKWLIDNISADWIIDVDPM